MRAMMVLVFVLVSNAAFSATSYFNHKGLAILGYDSVAYHIDAKAIKGNKAIAYEWSGATWLFSSEENRNKFKQSPEKYAPQYGGYCAYAASKGSLAPGDPKAWTVYEGKLYLNYSTSVRKTWLKNIDQHIQQANNNWPRLQP